jgi:hypothetical protein
LVNLSIAVLSIHARMKNIYSILPATLHTTLSVHRSATQMLTICAIWLIGIFTSQTIAQTYYLPKTGHQTISAHAGTVVATHGQYTNNQKGLLTLAPGFSGGRVEVQFNQWAVECNQDFFYVYDGVDEQAPLIGIYSCKRPETLKPSVFNSTGALTLRFVSDAMGVSQGISAQVRTRCSGGLASSQVMGDGTVHLSLINHYDGRIQWQSSLDGQSNWQDLSGANSATFTTSIRRTTYFRAIIPCLTEAPAYSSITTAQYGQLARNRKDDIPEPLVVCPTNRDAALTADAADPIICEGNSTTLRSSANIACLISDNFDAGINTRLWNFTNGETNTNCGASPQGGNSLHFNTGSAAIREAVTRDLNTTLSKNFNFWFRFGNQEFDVNPLCEDSDLPEENVLMQYSVDGGRTWITFFTLTNTGTYDGWGEHCVTIPAAAKTAATRFRFRQLENSGVGYDQWALDDVRFDITTGPDENFYTWTPAAGLTPGATVRNPTARPTVTTTYTITASNSCGYSTTATVTVTVNKPPVPGTVTGSATICSGSTTTLTLTGHSGGSIVRWEQAPTPCPTAPTSWTPIVNTTTTNRPAAVTASTCYRAVLRIAGCPDAFSAPGTISIDPIGMLSRDQNYCIDNVRPTELTHAGTTCAIVRWEQSTNIRCKDTPGTVTWTTVAGATGTRFTPPTTLRDTICYRTIVRCGTCPEQAVQPVRIDIDTFPSVRTTMAPEPDVCFGNTTEIRAGGVKQTIAFWQRSTNYPACRNTPNAPGVTWTRIGGSENQATWLNTPLFTETCDCYRPVARNGLICDPVPGPVEYICSFDCTEEWEPPHVRDTSICFNERATLRLIDTTSGMPGPGRCTPADPCPYRPQWSIVRWEQFCGMFNAAGDSIWDNIGFANANVITTAPLTRNCCYRVLLTSDPGPGCVPPPGRRRCPVSSVYSYTGCVEVSQPLTAGFIQIAPGSSAFVCPTGNTGTVNFLINPTPPGGFRINRWEKREWIIPFGPYGPWTTIAGSAGTTSQNWRDILTSTDFRVQIVDMVGCTTLQTNTVRVDVDSTTIPGRVVGGDTICVTTTKELTLLDYRLTIEQWQVQPGCTGPWTNITPRLTIDRYTPPTFTTAGNWCYRAEVKSGVCPAAFSAITRMTVIPIPSPGTLSGTTTVCAGDPSPRLTVTGATASINKWQSATGCRPPWVDLPVTATSYTPPPLFETTCFRVEVGSGICSRIADSIRVPVDPITKAGKLEGPPETCDTARLIITESTGTVTGWVFREATDCSTIAETDWIPVPGSAGRTTLDRFITATTCFRATLKSGVCPPANTNTFRVSIGLPTIAGSVAAEKPEVCRGDDPGVITLTGNRGRVIRWESTNLCDPWAGTTRVHTETATVFTISRYLTPPYTMTNCFRAVVQNGACKIETTAPVTVRVVDPPVGGTVRDDFTSCARPTTMPAFTLTGHSGTVLRWEVSLNCATFASPRTVTGTAGLTRFTAPDTITVVQCYRAIVGRGSCPEATSTWSTITILPSPIGGAITPSRTVCAPTTGPVSGTLTLGGHSGGSGTPQWESAEGASCTGTPPSFAGATPFTAGPGGVSHTYNVVTTTCFRARVRNAIGCEAFSDPAIITVSPPTLAGTVTASQTICVTATPAALNLTGHRGNVLRWERLNTTGTILRTIDNTTTTYTPDLWDANYCYRAVVQNPGCDILNSAQACVTVVPDPGGGAVTGGSSICFGASTGTLTLTGATGTVRFWEKQVGGTGPWTSIGHTGTTFTEADVRVNTCYRAVITGAICPEVRSTPTCVTVVDTSIGGTLTASQTICTGSTPAALNLSGHRTTVVRWESSTNSFGTVSTISHTGVAFTPPALTTTTCYRAVVQNSICPTKNSTSVCIRVDQRPIPGTITPEQTLCEGVAPAAMTLTGHTGTVRDWRRSTDGFTTSTSMGVVSTTILPVGLTTSTCYRAIVENGVCPPETTASACVTINPRAVAGTASGGTTICTGTTGTVTLAGQAGVINRIQWDVDNRFLTPTDVVSTANPFTTMALTAPRCFRYVITRAGCPDVFSLPTCFSIHAAPVGGAVAPDRTICSGTSAGNVNLTGHSTTVVRWESADNSLFTIGLTTINNTTTTHAIGTLAVPRCFRAVVTDAGRCANANSTPACVSINALSIGGAVAADQTICTGVAAAVVNLTGKRGRVIRWESSTTGATGLFTAIVGLPAIRYNADSTSFDPISPAVNTCYRAIVQNADCTPEPSSAACVTVTRSLNPGRVSPDRQICQGSSTGELRLIDSDPIGGTIRVLRWESAPDPMFAVITTIANTTPIHTELSLTSTRCYRAVIQNSASACPPVTSGWACVAVDLPSIAGTITSPATVCTGTNAGTLNLAGLRGNILDWRSSVTPAAFTTILPNNRTTSQTYLNLTANTCYQAIVQNGVCPPETTANVCITVDERSVAGTLSASQTVCERVNAGTISTVGARSTVVGWQTSTTGFTSGTPTFIPGGTTTFNFAGLMATTSYRVIISNGVCPADTSNIVTITVDQPSIAGTLAAPATVCTGINAGNIDLTGNRGRILGWLSETPDGTGVTPLTNPTNSQDYLNLTASTCYRAIVQNGFVCSPETTAAVCITVDERSIGGDLTADRTVCESGNSGTLTLSGHRTTIVGWQQSIGTACDNFVDLPPNTTNTQTYTNLTATSCFRVIVRNGVCAPVFSDTVRISVDPVSIGGTLSSAQTICFDEAATVLTLTGHRTNILWWERANDGTFTTGLTTITNSTNIHNPGRLRASECYRVRVQNGVCDPVYSNNICITVRPEVDGGNVTPDRTLCIGSSSGTLNWNSTTPTAEILRWESSTANFAPGSINVIPHTTSTLPSQPNIRVNTCFRAVVASVAGCPERFSTPACITVEDSAIAGTILRASTICAGTNPGLLSIDASRRGNVVAWQSSSSVLPFAFSNAGNSNTLDPGVLMNSRCYRVIVNNGACPNDTSDVVCISVDQQPTRANAGPDQTICVTNATLTSGNTPPITGLMQWRRLSGTAAFTGSTTNLVANVTGLALGANSFEFAISNGVCPTSRDTVIIRVDANPTPPNAGRDTVICQSSYTMAANTPASGTGTWLAVGTAPLPTPVNSPTANIIGLPIGRSTYIWRTQNGVCPTQQDTVVIQQDAQPTVADAGPNQTICVDNTELSANVPTVGVGMWSSGVPAHTFTPNVNANIARVSNLLFGNNVLTWTIRNGVCPPSVATVNILVEVPPTPANAGPDQTICVNDNNLVLSANPLAVGTGRWTVVSGPTTINFDDATRPNARVSSLGFGANTLRWTTTNGVSCSPTQDDIVITVDNLSVGGRATGGTTVCSGLNSGTVRLESHQTNVLHWESSINNGPYQIIPGTAGLTSIPYNNLTEATCYRAFVQNGICPPVYSIPTCFTVDLQTIPGTVLQNTTICSGDSTNRALVLSGSRGQILAWESSTSPTFVPLSTTVSSLNTINYTRLTQTTYFRARVQNGICPAQTSNTAEVRVVLPEVTLSRTNISCFGGTDGTVRTSVTGGLPFTTGNPYRYVWRRNREAFSILPNLVGIPVPDGEYCVTVSDAIGCTATACTTVVQPAPLVPTISAKKDVSCFGSNDGEIRINVSGGTTTSAYTFEWRKVDVEGVFARTKDVTGLSPGEYEVIIRDVNGCSSEIGEFLIISDPQIQSVLNYIQPVSCFGGSNGAIGQHVSGGIPPYRYRWSNGQTVEDPSGLRAGPHTVTITDAKNCPVVITYNVPQPPRLRIELSKLTNATCNGGSDGAIGVDVRGGVPNYTYLWSSASTVEDLMNVPSGRYTLTARDQNGCVTSRSFTVGQPTAVQPSISLVAGVNCNGSGSGALVVNTTGGRTPYRFLWSNGQTTASASGLNAGTHVVTVTDAAGCQGTASFTLQEGAGLRIRDLQLEHVGCKGLSTSSIAYTVEGGDGNYRFAWSGLSNTTEDLINLAAGTYTVTVVDGRNCRLVQSFTVGEPVLFLAGTARTITNESCTGRSDGSVDLVAVGGTAPYTYVWSNGTRTEDLMGVPGGEYSVEITDSKGCKTGLRFTIGTATAIQLVESYLKHASCFGLADGSIAHTVIGGRQPYTYRWSTGASSEDLVDLRAGFYSFTVTDANGCTAVRNETVNQPTQIKIETLRIDPAPCAGVAGGGASILVSGGSGEYTYEWSNNTTAQNLTNVPAGPYTVLVRDITNCTQTHRVEIPNLSAIQMMLSSKVSIRCAGGSNGAISVQTMNTVGDVVYTWFEGANQQIGGNTAIATGLKAGTYRVVARDRSGCEAVMNITLTEPAPLLATLATTPVSCANTTDGSANVVITGGTPIYSISWSNSFTGPRLTSMPAGEVSVSVTDRNGCRTRANGRIIAPESIILAVTAVEPVGCHNGATGSIRLSVNGGNAPYTYLWSDRSSNASLTNVRAGVYSVSVTDSRGCTQAMDSIVIAQPRSPLVVTTSYSNPVRCFGQANGAMGIDVTGGTEPYSYAWTTNATVEDVREVAAGTHTVTVTDAKGCTAVHNVTVGGPSAGISAARAIIIPATCPETASGAVRFEATGGMEPYRYSWSNGQTNAHLTNVPAGTYTVIVRDASDCSFSQTFDVPGPSPLVVQPTIRPVGCGQLGAISVNLSGGRSPYTYRWSSNASTTNMATGLASGPVNLFITDANGCLYVRNFTVPTVSDLSIRSVNVVPVSCNGGNNGKIELDIEGGSGSYTYRWSNNTAEEDLTNVPVGDYTVLVRDAVGCQLVYTATVTQPRMLELLDGVVVPISCNGRMAVRSR